MPDPPLAHQPVPARGARLPDEPPRRSDMPAGAVVTVGRLVTYRNRAGRPFVGLLADCRKCRRVHRYHWRWSWGLSPDVVSFQESRCAKGPRRPEWVGLDPVAAAGDAATHRAAHEAFAAWDAARAARKAANAAEAGPDGPSGPAPPPAPHDPPR
jgi:hypothetical protein